jgi:predicted DNA binding CopG/RHH family protein
MSRVESLENLDKLEKLEQLASMNKQITQDLTNFSQRLKTELRKAAQIEYFNKYGEKDWVVRKRYMNLIKSLAYQWPYSDDARGYAFGLFNFNEGGSIVETMTEFVKPENIHQCKLSPKIVEAFLLLKYLPELNQDAEGTGFCISRKEEVWKEFSGFDYEGYKFHMTNDE